MESALSFLHARLAVALILLALLLGVWGAYLYARYRAVSAGFRASYLILAGLTAAQSLAGLAELLAGGRLHDLLHFVYGIFAVVFVPGMYAYVGRRDRVREAAFLTIACWVVLVAFLRGQMTGH